MSKRKVSVPTCTSFSNSGISFLTLGMKKPPSFVHKKYLSYIQKKEGENTASDMQFFYFNKSSSVYSPFGILAVL